MAATIPTNDREEEGEEQRFRTLPKPEIPIARNYLIREILDIFLTLSLPLPDASPRYPLSVLPIFVPISGQRKR